VEARGLEGLPAGSPCWQTKAAKTKVPIRESILKKFGFIRLHPLQALEYETRHL
jgi:hypothetical protein